MIMSRRESRPFISVRTFDNLRNDMFAYCNCLIAIQESRSEFVSLDQFSDFCWDLFARASTSISLSVNSSFLINGLHICDLKFIDSFAVRIESVRQY